MIVMTLLISEIEVFYFKLFLKMRFLYIFWVEVIAIVFSYYQNSLLHSSFIHAYMHFFQCKFVFTQCSRHCDYPWIEFNNHLLSPTKHVPPWGAQSWKEDWYVNKSIFIIEEKNHIQGSQLKGGSFQLSLKLLKVDL